MIIIVDLQRFQSILNMISKINFQPFAYVFVFQPISNLVTKMNIRIDMSSFTVWSDRGGRIWGHLDPLNWGRATFNLCDKSKTSTIFDTRNLRKHFSTFFVKKITKDDSHSRKMVRKYFHPFFTNVSVFQTIWITNPLWLYAVLMAEIRTQ